LYGEWVEATRTANSDIKNIKYVMVWSMSNSISAPAVAKALEVVGKSLENWPGTQFDIDDPEGRAMLGASNPTFPYFPYSSSTSLYQSFSFSILSL
jgi:hypothetical protein